MSAADNILDKELRWFATVLDQRFQNYFSRNEGEEEIDLETLTPPDLGDSEQYYAQIVEKYDLGYKERIALMLALAPHLRPQLLDIFFTKNSIFDRAFTEFGGQQGKSHPGFLPTGETLNFILNTTSLDGREEVLNLLSRDSVLVKNDLLHLEQTEKREPVLSGHLVPGDDFLSILTTGREVSHETSEAFPARKTTTDLCWEDLIVAPFVRDELDKIRLWIEHQQVLMSCSTFSKHVKPGYRSLFYGPPGTGKTLTACLLGKSTGLDVYRVDLSLIVSKYIGETEKNLSKIFDCAQKKNWILFFDEADSLFGKRTSTSSSNDRYANQEVAYLLQRVEDFPGVIILASNLKSNIDEAFSRRFQSIVYFPMPDKQQRLLLWQQLFSGKIPLEAGCNLETIADKYELSGGSAINILRYASIKALSREPPEVKHDDILEGIRKEYQKYGKTI